MSIIIVSLFVIVFLLWIYKRTQKPKDFPPGPPRWPLIGSLPYITGQNGSLLLGLVKPVQKFGPVIGYYVGNTPAVLVADYNILREITVTPTVNLSHALFHSRLGNDASTWRRKHW
jgi:hypothetical protein